MHKILKCFTNFAVKILRTIYDYCKESVAQIDVGSIQANELNDLLCEFYISMRTKKEELYKINSMRAIRRGLQRYFQC